MLYPDCNAKVDFVGKSYFHENISVNMLDLKCQTQGFRFQLLGLYPSSFFWWNQHHDGIMELALC
jgi:hypothetical protein